MADKTPSFESEVYVFPAGDSKTRGRVEKTLPETRRVANVSSQRLCTVNGGPSLLREKPALSAHSSAMPFYWNFGIYIRGGARTGAPLATKCALKGEAIEEGNWLAQSVLTPRVLSYRIRFYLTKKKKKKKTPTGVVHPFRLSGRKSAFLKDKHG